MTVYVRGKDIFGLVQPEGVVTLLATTLLPLISACHDSRIFVFFLIPAECPIRR